MAGIADLLRDRPDHHACRAGRGFPANGRAPTRTRPPSNRGQASAERWRGSIFEGAWGGLRTGRTQPRRVLGIAPPTRRGVRASVTQRRAIIGDDGHDLPVEAGAGQGRAQP